MANAKEVGRLDNGKNLMDIFLYGSPENGIPAHVAIARKALLGDDRNAVISIFQFLAKQNVLDIDTIDKLWIWQ